MIKMTPALVDQTLLEMRGRVLALAADFDRLQRDEAVWKSLQSDARISALRGALQTALEGKPERAARVQMIFSDRSPEIRGD